MLPVVPRADAEGIKSHAVTRHRYFLEGSVRRYTLASNMRASQDKAYSEFLLQVGDGAYPAVKIHDSMQIRIPDSLLAPVGTTVDSLADWVFGNVVTMGLKCVGSTEEDVRLARDHLSKRAVLAPKNIDVDSFNQQVLQKFPAESLREYASSDDLLAVL